MPDYGLPLQFGAFITPANSPPQAAVDRARFVEELGFDLVTFQDHPYQPTFLDAWTLMTWVAASTERIHIAPNVLNLPLRPPAVVARAASSLDLLSDGRFDLGLGAGGFWDAIESMGGRRLTPGQGVDALSEAIDIIRGIWSAGERGGLRVSGDYYSVNGAKRGPAPAHDIPIWIGALKPRMLRLTGEKGDGWLPSLAYLKPGEFAAGNRAIDAAAIGVGRDPREIRRLVNIGGSFGASNGGFLNGPSEQWVEELLPYVLEEGVATFILASDDPSTLGRFAQEVAPALRSLVDAARATAGITAAVPRRAAVVAQRRDAIDYEGVPDSLAATAVEPGDSDYHRVRSTYMRGGAPGLVLRPKNTEQVVEALAYSRGQDVALSIRSAGHGISGRSTNDGGIVIDLGAMNAIEILDAESRLVRIEPGALWMDVAAALEPHGLALSSGDYGGVGVGGLATAGGIGWMAREHGLTIDHLRSAEVVLANGEIVHASATENPDLFWAVRGAGANFGIVVSFVFEVDVVGEVGWAQLAFDAADTAGFLERWGTVVEAAPRDLTSFVILGPPRGGRSVATVLALVDSADPDTIIARLQPFAEIAPLLDQSVQLTSYAQVMANAQGGDHSAQGDPQMRSGLLKHITPDFAAAASAFIASGETYFFQVRSVGGAVADVADDATAYGYRSANFSVAAVGSHPTRFASEWQRLYDHFSGLYLSFETDQHADRLADAFPPKTLARLRELKARFDPDNVFRDNFNITPAVAG